MNVRNAERNARTQYRLVAVFALVTVLGIACIASASYYHAGQSQDSDFNSFYYIQRQAIWALAAVAAFALVSMVRAERWQQLAPYVFAVAFGLTMLVFTPLGVGQRWLVVGPIQIQPSEFLKCALIVLLACYLPSSTLNPRRPDGFIKALGLIGVSALVVFKQDDLGTALVLLMIGFGMLVAANAHKRHLAALTGVLAALVWLGVRLEPYRWQRVPAWREPWEHARDVALQTCHSLHAFGAGALKGVGIGQGLEKYWLPAPHTDFVFSTVAEETGIIGPAAILALFVALGVLGYQIAFRSKDMFARLGALGVVIYLCGQAALNIAVATNTVPCTGVPLPFISYGGSSLVAGAIAFGLLSSFSRASVRRKRENADEGYGDGWGYRRARVSGPGGDYGAASPKSRRPDPVLR